MIEGGAPAVWNKGVRMYALKTKLHERQRSASAGSLKTISLDVTSRCNMACPHCYAEPFMRRAMVDLSPLKDALGEAIELGAFHFVLQGGEPITDMERLEAIIAMIRPEQSYLNVVSNGWAMTQEKVRRLKDLQVDKIAFSLDSGLGDEHDEGRGKGSFERVMRSIDTVLEEGLLTSVSTVVTHESLYGEGFKAALKFAQAKGIRIDVQIAMPVGKWEGRWDLLITPEDAKHIKDMQTSFPVLPNGQRMINRDIFNFGGQDHCPAGTEFLAITADGNVMPCNFCQFSLGHIGDRPLTEMRHRLIQNPWFQAKNPRCLVGEDPEFIKTYIAPVVGAAKPMDAYAAFGL